MNIQKAKLEKALEEAVIDARNNRFVTPNEARSRAEARGQAEGKVELIRELLGIPNRLKAAEKPRKWNKAIKRLWAELDDVLRALTDADEILWQETGGADDEGAARAYLQLTVAPNNGGAAAGCGRNRAGRPCAEEGPVFAISEFHPHRFRKYRDTLMFEAVQKQRARVGDVWERPRGITLGDKVTPHVTAEDPITDADIPF